jgi:hypothetical protein
LIETIEPLITTAPPRRHQRQRLLHGEERALDVNAEILVEVCLGDMIQWHKLTATGVREENVEAARLFADHVVEPVEVG